MGNYYTDREYLSEFTDDQYWRMIEYTQANPDTEFRIICFCGNTPQGTRLVLWRGPAKFHTLFALTA